MAELSKGMKLAMGMFGVTPEMLANPAEMLKQFGINPDDLLKKVAEFQQIGVRIEAAFNQNNARLARIEAHLGIAVTNHADTSGNANGDGGGKLDDLGQCPPDRRN